MMHRVLLEPLGLRGSADLSQLRQKFAEDKRKIAELKAARRFKPY